MGRWSGALSDSALADSPSLFRDFQRCSEISRDFQRVPGFDFEVILGFPKVRSLRYVQKSYRCCVFLRVCGSVEHFYDFRDVQRCSLLQIRDFWDLTFRGSGVEVV